MTARRLRPISAKGLAAKARKAGIALSVEGGTLIAQGLGALPPGDRREWRQTIHERREDLITALDTTPNECRPRLTGRRRRSRT